MLFPEFNLLNANKCISETTIQKVIFLKFEISSVNLISGLFLYIYGILFPDVLFAYCRNLFPVHTKNNFCNWFQDELLVLV